MEEALAMGVDLHLLPKSPMVQSFVTTNSSSSSPAVVGMDPSALLSFIEPYDINSALPLHVDTLTSCRKRLTPLVPLLQARRFWDVAELHLDELFRYFSYALRTSAASPSGARSPSSTARRATRWQALCRSRTRLGRTSAWRSHGSWFFLHSNV